STNIVPAETGPCSIFCDGFEDEPGSTALVLPGEDARAAGWILHQSGSDKPGVALELLDASGKAMAWLDTLKAGNTQLVRLRHRSADGIERASAWSRWNGGDVLGYGWDLSVDGL